MPEQERNEIIEIVHDAVESAINKRIVSALVWVVCVGVANFFAIVSGIWMFWNVQNNTQTAIADRWTGTMESVSEVQRKQRNPSYQTVDVRALQQEFRP